MPALSQENGKTGAWIPISIDQGMRSGCAHDASSFSFDTTTASSD